ncbi:DUF1036 domain-containing protein [Oleisolibacter albus]|uniref:DUF1036 domain-containing protein n=1 Tax=Oleisolibacter albus TaxID=2171757 RepID=UPI0013902144|nr:DUF1036 domain-containing protein [Oleisolibacter albus]
MRGIILVGLAALLLPVSPAEARLTVCNKSSDTVRVAVGAEEAEGWLSRGWWQIKPGACATVIETDLTQADYYLYARPLTPGAAGWAGEYPFCIDAKDFRIRGDAACEARGHVTAGYFVVTTDGATSVTHTLTD